MKSKNKTTTNWLQINVIRAARIYFYTVFVCGAALIAADAGKLFSPQDVFVRWKILAMLLSTSAIVWYAARRSAKSNLYYQVMAYMLILSGIALAAFSVHTERGMASNSVALFALPIAASAVLTSRAALFATAALCTAAYWLSSISYFVLNFNQGYKLELYMTLSFYSAGFFLLAAMLWIVVRQIPAQK
jgi:hypothetical protein